MTRSPVAKPDPTVALQAYRDLIVRALRRDFAGADLRDIDLSGAYLTGVNLTDADLTGATFIGAYLTNATLMGADLTGTTFTGAHLTDADFRGASGLTDEQRADFKRRGAIVD